MIRVGSVEVICRMTLTCVHFLLVTKTVSDDTGWQPYVDSLPAIRLLSLPSPPLPHSAPSPLPSPSDLVAMRRGGGGRWADGTDYGRPAGSKPAGEY